MTTDLKMQKRLDSEGEYWNRPKGGNAPITFRQYLKRVISDPMCGNDFKLLIELFGMPKLENVLDGKLLSSPQTNPPVDKLGE